MQMGKYDAQVSGACIRANNLICAARGGCALLMVHTCCAQAAREICNMVRVDARAVSSCFKVCTCYLYAGLSIRLTGGTPLSCQGAKQQMRQSARSAAWDGCRAEGSLLRHAHGAHTFSFSTGVQKTAANSVPRVYLTRLPWATSQSSRSISQLRSSEGRRARGVG